MSRLGSRTGSRGKRWSSRSGLARIGLVAFAALAPVAPAQGVEVHGTVVVFRSELPLADVEVAIASLGLAARSDSAGRFRLVAVPAGRHLLTARRLGYQSIETAVLVGDVSPPSLRIVMLPVQRVDSVRVVATPLTNALLEFEEHRRVGLGSFLTREQLQRYDGLKLTSVMPQLSGVSLVRAGQWALLTSRRQTVGGRCLSPKEGISEPGQPLYTPTFYEANRGVKCTCYAHVYVDGVLQNPGKPADPFDVNALPIDDVEAVEWYAGPAQTPLKYARLNSACGVLVVHTRHAADRLPDAPPARSPPLGH